MLISLKFIWEATIVPFLRWSKKIKLQLICIIVHILFFILEFPGAEMCRKQPLENTELLFYCLSTKCSEQFPRWRRIFKILIVGIYESILTHIFENFIYFNFIWSTYVLGLDLKLINLYVCVHIRPKSYTIDGNLLTMQTACWHQNEATCIVKDHN
jgi:hypothetical protein